MKIEHIAVSSHNEKESDEFFMELLGLKKTRSFTVKNDLMRIFFGVNKEQKVVRYSNSDVNFEVFFTEENKPATDRFTHSCLMINDRNKLVDKARKKQYEIIKVQRKDSSGPDANKEKFYLFIRDKFGNLYEIKKLLNDT